MPSSRRKRCWCAGASGVHAGVVGQGGDALLAARRRLVDLAPRQAIDDAGLAAVISEEAQQLARGLSRVDDGVADVGPVEAGDEDARLVEPRRVMISCARQRVGGRRQRDARHRAGSARAAARAAGIPGGSRGPIARRSAPRRWRTARAAPRSSSGPAGRGSAGEQALRRDVEQVEFAAQQRALDRPRAFEVERGIEEGRAHAGLQQRVDLVLHQRDQRRDDDADAFGAAAPESGSTATCRRRSASAPARRRRCG
jgi:hypothetical protein